MTSGDGNDGPQPQADGNFRPHQNAPRSVYFDWSGGPVHALHDDAEQAVIYGGLDDLLDHLTGPTRVRGEATFESFNVAKRAEFTDRCEREGHDFRVINPRATAKRRALLGLEKSDEVDVAVIRDLANDGKTHFTPVVIAPDEKVAMREAANTRLMNLRRTRTPRRSKLAKIGWAFDVAKDQYADEIIARLPDPSTLTVEQDLALCTGPEGKRKYSKCVVAAIGVVAEYARNIKEFDFLTGLYHNGYPSQIRSDLMMHRWGKTLREREADPAKNRPYRPRVIELTAFRRELRWLFHQIKEVDGNGAPQQPLTATSDRNFLHLPAERHVVSAVSAGGRHTPSVG